MSFNDPNRKRSQYAPYYADEQELINEHAPSGSQWEQGNTEMERFPERYEALRGKSPDEQRLIRAQLRSQGIY